MRVITYGTYDLFHEGHYRLLERAKALGDYLIVGVTSESFDKNRGKLNVRDSLMQRIENVRATGFADEIIVEEYIGQKIDDIKRYNIDIFTVGSDWEGHFDYLNEYCTVKYLPRTQGVSSTAIRNKSVVSLGIIGAESIVRRFACESRYVSGLAITGLYDRAARAAEASNLARAYGLPLYTELDDLIAGCTAVYICSPPSTHYAYAKKALECGRHVLMEFPFALSRAEAEELFTLARERGLILFHALKTAYCPAFLKLVALARSGIIGRMIAVDASFTQVLGSALPEQLRIADGGSINALGEYPLLAMLRLLGHDIESINFISRNIAGSKADGYTKFIVRYPQAVAIGTTAIDAKSEGLLTITGTRGYLYVPAPWWKTEYFEARFEDVNKNLKFFYKFQGDGLRYELAEFTSCVLRGEMSLALTPEETLTMVSVLERYRRGEGVVHF